MALDKLVDSAQLDSDLTSVANAIRAKSGGSGQLAFPAEFVSEIGNIPTGGSNWKLLEEKTFSNLSEYTNTSVSETIGSSSISYKNTDYAWLLAIVTCDSAITTSTEWGMTISIFGRYTSNGNVYAGTPLQQKGSSTLSRAAMVNATMSQGGYGVYALNNTGGITFTRKAHSSGCPKIRGGNYTLRVYGLESL